MRRYILASALICALGAACTHGGDGLPPSIDGPAVAVDVAALELIGVGDVVWDLEVRNGAPDGGDVVWQRRVTSTAFGDGAGSATYIGPCDASAGVEENVIRVWVVGLYEDAIAPSAAGQFNAGATDGVGAVTGTAMPFQNPSAGGPLTQTVTCSENADAAASFSVAIMRPANQGFFDIAVDFNDVFCSAKFDCCENTENGCEDIELLFDGDARAKTMVLGLACAAGGDPDAVTELALDRIELDCDGAEGADVAIDPSAGSGGNMCTSGDIDACEALRTADGVSASTYLYQIAAYRGTAQAVGAGDGGIVYWNMAFGVTDAAANCRLTARATADDAADDADGIVDGALDAGSVYPYIAWDVPLGTCGAEALTFDDPDAPVTVAYTAGDGSGPQRFGYGYQGGGQAACHGDRCGQVIPGGVALLMDACPAGWTPLGQPAGPGATSCSGANCFACQAPEGGATPPVGREMIMRTCPTGWMSNGLVPAGPGSGHCDTLGDTDEPALAGTSASCSTERSATTDSNWDAPTLSRSSTISLQTACCSIGRADVTRSRSNARSSDRCWGRTFARIQDVMSMPA